MSVNKDALLKYILAVENADRLADIISRLSDVVGRLETQLSVLNNVLNTLNEVSSRLDANLSSRASESTLVSVLNTLNTIASRLDVNLSSRASESTLASIQSTLTTGSVKVDRTSSNITFVTIVDRTGTGTSTEVDVSKYRDIEVIVHVTSVSGTNPSMTVFIEGRDVTSSQYKTLCTLSDITAPGNYWCTISPIIFNKIRARWVISSGATFRVGIYGSAKS